MPARRGDQDPRQQGGSRELRRHPRSLDAQREQRASTALRLDERRRQGQVPPRRPQGRQSVYIEDRRLVMSATPRLAVGAAFLVAVSGCSTAPPQLEREFQRLDVNGDGYISRAEARADDSVARQFEMADQNRDGKLDR